MHNGVASDGDGAVHIEMPRIRDIDFATLAPHWHALAENASEPNPFLEPWFLKPSLEQFDPRGDAQLILVYAAERLVGLMPIASTDRYYDHTIAHFTNWQHDNMFCGAPLVARGYERTFWKHLIIGLNQCASDQFFVHLRNVPGDGPLFSSLRSINSFRIVARGERAMLRHGLTPNAHLETAFSKKRRKELNRKRRRLEEEGTFAFVRHRNAADLDAWITAFLELEEASWKGDENSALASSKATRSLFSEVMRGAAAADKLERLAFYSDGRPIAMLAQFHTPPGAFSFKTCFDARLYSLSPGMLLQVENLDLLNNVEIRWCDSCAAPNHPMIDRIWFDRRDMVSVSIPVGRGLRRLAGRALTAIEERRAKARQ